VLPNTGTSRWLWLILLLGAGLTIVTAVAMRRIRA
jgi:LPXTG-motif cell wall-anchored protein